MRALRKLEPGASELTVSHMPVPQPGTGEVRIVVFAAGMCGTDLHIIDGSYSSSPPVTLGHEIAGRVDSVGSGVDEGWIGTRVAPAPAVSCGHCEWCEAGIPMHCLTRRSLGTHIDGGFAEYVIAPVRNLHVLPSSLSDRAGALLEPLACVCNALTDPELITPGDRVLVTGPGTIGILAAQAALAFGARTTLLGLDRDSSRLAIASKIGLDARSLDDPETRRALEDEASNRRIHMVIECSGAEPAVAWALSLIRPRGRLVQLGLLSDDASISLAGAIKREISITSSFGSTPASWGRGIELVAADVIKLEPLMTSVLPLDGWAEAVRQSQAQEGIKTLFDPGAPRVTAERTASSTPTRRLPGVIEAEPRR